MVFVLFECGVAPGVPAQLHATFFQAGSGTARGDFFVAINISNEAVDDVEDRFDEAHHGVDDPGAVVGKAQA
ncbi:hypothetical protein PS858_05683 [Pseudomonas fluorescens]|nr:hypothetical protein PS858_05683 [Pseudomonas fluorescens]